MGSPTSADQPLNDAWWLDVHADDLPPDDAAILAPYEKTCPGFELLVGKTLEGQQGFDCFPVNENGYQRICLWSIWQRGSDPAEVDIEKQRINEMQRALGELSDDDRYIRIQIACFQRCWWEFPANVDLILDGIGTGQVNLDGRVSCEPPWAGMIAVVRHRRGHPAPCARRYQTAATDYAPLAPRRNRARAYMRILTWWTYGGEMDCLKLELPDHAELAETVYRRLGPTDKLKMLYVQKLRAALGWQAFPQTGFDDRACVALVAVWDAAIREELGRKPDHVRALIGPQDLCHHGFFRRLDHQIANIGAGKAVKLPGTGEERKRIHGTVTTYVHALGSWLAGRTPEEVASIWPASKETARRAYERLGGVSPRKRWLVASLWKRLQDNQADHGRGALDEQPERFTIPRDALTV